MKAWAIALVALVAAAGAVTGAILIPRGERSRDKERLTNPVSGQPSFTVIDDGKTGKKPSASATPAPAGTGSATRSGSGGGTTSATRPNRGTSTHVTSGEFAESSDGEDELEAEQEEEEEEAEQEAKEEADKQRCEEKQERDPDADC